MIGESRQVDSAKQVCLERVRERSGQDNSKYRLSHSIVFFYFIFFLPMWEILSGNCNQLARNRSNEYNSFTQQLCGDHCSPFAAFFVRLVFLGRSYYPSCLIVCYRNTKYNNIFPPNST